VPRESRGPAFQLSFQPLETPPVFVESGLLARLVLAFPAPFFLLCTGNGAAVIDCVFPHALARAVALASPRLFPGNLR
jgi:hypothetical protein